VLDAQGKIAWGRADIGGDPIVVVLTERVSDAHLAGLRKDAVSYIFAGEREPDLGRALDILNKELGIKRLELNGGGITNGSFLRAGLIDEISLAIFPAIDGAKGASCVFDSRDEESGMPAPLRSMMLESSEVLEGGAV
jgi:riboflavin biosynthesis pyrimidine reductase